MSSYHPAARTPPSPGVHPLYVRLLCDVLRKHGLDVTALLAAAGLAPASLGEAAASIKLSQVLSLIRLARHQCADALLPIEWGRRIRSNVHGNVGTAIFASSTVRQALRSAETLVPLRCAGLRLSLDETGAWARLRGEATAPLYGLDDFVATTLAFALLDVLRNLLGRHIGRVCVEFPFAPPVWAADRQGHCPSDASFGAATLAFRFPAELLDRALPSADAHAHETAMRQCQLDLHRRSARLAERLAAYLAGHAETYPTLDQAADYFCLSPRTLRRTLQHEGESYQRIFDRVRMDAAALLLKESPLSIDAVSLRAGYRDASNFIRAFRKFHGCTPRQFREATPQASREGSPPGRVPAS